MYIDVMYEGDERRCAHASKKRGKCAKRDFAARCGAALSRLLCPLMEREVKRKAFGKCIFYGFIYVEMEIYIMRALHYEQNREKL